MYPTRRNKKNAICVRVTGSGDVTKMGITYAVNSGNRFREPGQLFSFQLLEYRATFFYIYMCIKARAHAHTHTQFCHFLFINRTYEWAISFCNKIILSEVILLLTEHL